MAKKFIHKKSETTTEVPTHTQLERGELAINLPDKKIYTKDQSDTIVDLTADADTVGGVEVEDLLPQWDGQAYNLGMGKYQYFNDYDDDVSLNHGIRAYVRDGAWYLNKHTGETNSLQLRLDGDYVAEATSDIDRRFAAYNSLGGIGVYSRSYGNSAISQLSASGVIEKHWISFEKDGDVDLKYDGDSKLQTTSTGIDVTGKAAMTQVYLGSGITGGLMIEDGKHAINSNDGGGNFNIRVGNHFTTGITEEGYAFHQDFSQSAGSHIFKITSASQTLGQTPIWSNVLTLYSSVILNHKTIRPSSTLSLDLGTSSYVYNNVYATNFIGKSSDSDKLGGASKDITAVGNTIVQRDSNADIYGRYLFSNYVNMNHAQGTRSADTVFYSSTDSYVRKNTAAGFRTSLDVYSKAESDGLGGSGGLESVQVFTSSGTWTKPAGITKVRVEVVGGGGGGGYQSSGGGGGGGGTAIELIDVTSITSETITRGGGGAGGTSISGTASTGGTSSFGAHCSATGGYGGTNNVGVTGGIGGIGSGGNLNIKGQGGSVGNNTDDDGGAGGSSYLGGGGRGTSSSDEAGGAYGGGGSGGGGGASIGGNGANGAVIVWEYK